MDQVAVSRCTAGMPWANYPRTQSLTPQSTCTPETLADLAAIVRDAEATGMRVHAFGSRWSFSDCAITGDRVVDTTRLNREINTVQRALRPDRQDLAPLLYHVEAGMRIRDACENLERMGLALETMGGAAEQRLAGAISTGTHGGDKHLAPLADSVLAIHLVGTGGTQYWIEPSDGITDPVLLRERVAPGVNAQNILYDDNAFSACLVSLGCVGVIYAFVLRARARYDLVETSVAMPWDAFRSSAAGLLADRDIRFLQVLINPYPGPLGNLCMVTTRREDEPTVRLRREPGDIALPAGVMVGRIILENPLALPLLIARGALNPNLSAEERTSLVVDEVLARMPGQRHIRVEHYDSLMATYMPARILRGLSYSVMDMGYNLERRDSQPGHSIEISFRALGDDGNLHSGFLTFMAELVSLVNVAGNTFFTGYMSIRFSGRTWAYLGMQQWDPTCSIEIATVQGVRGLRELLARLYTLGLRHGGLPHWGQMLDFDPAVRGHGRLYRSYVQWKGVYARMSNNFTSPTFENDLSTRWQLTTAGVNFLLGVPNEASANTSLTNVTSVGVDTLNLFTAKVPDRYVRAMYAAAYGTGPTIQAHSVRSDAVVGVAAGSDVSQNGVRGQASRPGVSGVYGENTGGGIGVAGRSSNASGSGIGVIGDANSPEGVGVVGLGGGTGVYAFGGQTGMHGAGREIGVRGAVYEGVGVTGVYGTCSTDGVGVQGFSANGIGVYANGGESGLYATGSGGVAGRFNGNVFVNGNLTVLGTKSAAVDHPDGSRRQLYVLESPESWFEDFGQALLENGRAEVAIDPDFADLIRTDDYQVFLTPYGDCQGLYVSDRNTAGFTVRELQQGTTRIQFGYRILARRKDVEARRLERLDMPGMQDLPASSELAPPTPAEPPVWPEPLAAPTLLEPESYANR